MTLKLDKYEWKRIRFGDAVRNINESVRAPEGEGIDRVIAMEHLDPGKLTINRWGSLDDGTSFTRRVRPGQTLFGKRRAYQRKVAFAEFDAICPGDILTFEADESELLADFLPFLVQSDAFFDHALGTSAGSLSPRTNWRDLAKFEFNLPPLKEQQRIADLLWAIERHRLSLASSSLSRLHDNMLRELLNVHAPTRPVATVGTVVMGRQRAPKYAEGPNMVLYLRVANVGDDELRLDDVKQMNFTPAEQARYSVEPDDILISEGQSRELVGQSVLVTELPEPMCFQNTLIRFRPNRDLVRPRYAQSLFRACLKTGVFADLSRQTTSIAHLGAQRFAQLELPWPSLEDQDKALDRHHSLLVALGDVSQEIARLQDLRTAILADTFGGR